MKLSKIEKFEFGASNYYKASEQGKYHELFKVADDKIDKIIKTKQPNISKEEVLYDLRQYYYDKKSEGSAWVTKLSAVLIPLELGLFALTLEISTDSNRSVVVILIAFLFLMLTLIGVWVVDRSRRSDQYYEFYYEYICKYIQVRDREIK
ncbi:MAG: hypothetical protein E7B11_27975 [Clostridiales bacterium]|nr:hypothetical protein [Clostridiales bacterium]MDU3244387.1 hypothetical protein [Clostridiales bacterium]